MLVANDFQIVVHSIFLEVFHFQELVKPHLFQCSEDLFRVRFLEEDLNVFVHSLGQHSQAGDMEVVGVFVRDPDVSYFREVDLV